MFAGASPDPEKLESIQEALGWYNKMLKGKEFATGAEVTIADHSLAATVSTIVAAGELRLTCY